MKKFLCVITFIFLIMPVFAYELDVSVDEDIKQKYNSSKLSDEMLPQLPQKLKNTSNMSVTPSSNTNSSQTYSSVSVPNYPKISGVNKSGIKISRWTTFKLKSSTKITNWSGQNAAISFTSLEPVYKKNITIPSGTVFKGNIVKTHSAQVTGNGALVEVKVSSMIYNGKTVPISSVVTKVNGENIFFNRIKGARQYVTGVKNKVKSATNIYQKGRNTSAKLSKNPVGTILSPLPTIGGFVAGAVGTVASPITGLVQKGGNVTIPAGSTYEIRLIDDAYVN